MKAMLTALTGLMLIGCTSAPKPVSYYSLNRVTASQAAPTSKTLSEHPLVVLARPQLADYLRQSFLVMQTGAHQLHFARQHVWAESLSTSIQKALINRISQSGTIEVIQADDPRATQTNQQLRVHIEQLLPTAEGQLYLTARYWFTHDSGHTMARQYQQQLTLSKDGYAHAVKTMHTAIMNLADAIAESINRSFEDA